MDTPHKPDKSNAPPKDTRPALVGVPCDCKKIADQFYHAVGEKYVTALIDAAGVLPILVPVPPSGLDPDTVLERIDGLMVPGSPSNVHPDRYGGPAPRPETALDEQRDAVSLPLIARAVDRGIPVLAVCRGFQELNVALGGSLHQHIHEVPSQEGRAPRFDHREPYGEPIEVRYAQRHNVDLTPGGLLEAILGTPQIHVNSLHGQAVDRLAPGLRVEARAPDGTIEAASLPGANAFTVGVQWHPDWHPLETDHYAKIYRAFGAAVLNARGQPVRTQKDHVS